MRSLAMFACVAHTEAVGPDLDILYCLVGQEAAFYVDNACLTVCIAELSDGLQEADMKGQLGQGW